MAPFGFDDDEWLAAQYLLFLDETGDEEEARKRTEALRAKGGGRKARDAEALRIEQAAQRAIARMRSQGQAQPASPAEAAARRPAAPRNPGLWARFWAWVGR